MMAGGKHSFGAGGYFESGVDELLPISMELKNEHRKLAVAMAIVMDRSGSMSAGVAGAGGGAGGRPMTKMDLGPNHDLPHFGRRGRNEEIDAKRKRTISRLRRISTF